MMQTSDSGRLNRCDIIREAMASSKPLIVGAIGDSTGLSEQVNSCDVVELRIDGLGAATEVKNFAEACPKPLLITVRGAQEGGSGDLSLEERTSHYLEFLPFATAIDVELRDFTNLLKVIEAAKESGVVVVGSHHHFEETPESSSLYEKIDSRADIQKFALMTNSLNDLKRQLDLMERLSEHPAAVMGMGPLGAAARPLMAKAGSILNYGYLGKTPTAPNQWPADLLQAAITI